MPKVKNLCNFDSENLKVWYSNSNDTIFYINNLGYALSFQYLEFNSIDYISPKYHSVNAKEIWLQTFTISNIGCLDTLWAKKVIKEELKRRCPFEYTFSDTFCVRKHYKVQLADSSLLVKSKYLEEETSAYLSGDLDAWVINHGVDYMNICDYVVPSLIGRVDDTFCDKSVGFMMDSLSGKFDLKIYINTFEQLGEESHIKMISDSLGFDVKWVKDELVPYKIITYTKKKE